MKQFFAIMKFEFNNYVKTKTFISLTVIIVLLVGIVLSFPRFSSLFSSDDTQPVDTDKPLVALADQSGANPEDALEFFSQAMPERSFVLTDLTTDQLKDAVSKGEFDSAIVIEAPLKYAYITESVGIYDTTTYTLDQILAEKYRLDVLEDLGLSGEQAQQLMNAQVESSLLLTGKDQTQSFFYTYILIFALYMAILLYGQLVANSVAAEKSSRAMELLITSTKPTSLMFGKVIGSGLAGLFQMTLILGSGFLFYSINKSYWGDNVFIESIFGMPLSMLLYTLLFFILGFFIYSFLYGALGSLASRSEDINTLTLPVTFLFIIAFFVVMYSMNSGDLNSPLIIACSYIPFTSPMAMFTRIAMSSVPTYEIILSVAILIAANIGIGYLSAAIYRVGVLLYGKPPKMGELFKILRAKN